MANSFTSGSDLYRQTDERLWFQNPIQALSPEVIRPFSWSQVPSRLALYEEEDMLPQQTLAAAGGTQDFSSSYNVSTNINSEYNFDVQQNSTSFVYNSNNTNNTVEVSYTTDDSIHNAGDNIVNNTTTGGTSGATGSITSISSLGWDDVDMLIYYNITTTTVVNGLVTAIVYSGATTDLTLAKLKVLSDWYESAESFSITDEVGDVRINGTLTALVKDLYSWTFDHGLLLEGPNFSSTTGISDLTDCPP